MKYSRLTTLLLAALIAGPATAARIAAEMRHDGATRTYQLYLPSAYATQTRLPLLLALHGRSGNARRMAQLTGFDQRADEQGFIVVYADGLGGYWNYLHGIPGAPPGADDSGFLLALIDKLAVEYPVDRKRIYVAGISNGGFMAQRLACNAATPFAGFASVAAGGYAAMQDNCSDSPPLDALYLHGTADRLVPWEGLAVEDAQGHSERVTWSLTQSLKFWAKRNRCGADVDVFEVEPGGRSPGTSVRIIASQSCRGDVDVVLYAVLGGGHNWPGVIGLIPGSVAGQVNLDIHASDVIWSFFDRRHRYK